MEVKIKKLYKDSILPTKAHATDAGYDLYAHSKSYDNDGNVVYGSGVAMEIPQGYVGLVFPRSSNAKKDLILSNSVGLIDSGFRGEISFKFKPSNVIEKPDLAYVPESISKYEVGDRIGQIIIMPYPEIEFVEVEELSDSERGDGSYGSSGK
jgi:dUTP pyrophosphatase